MYLTEERRLERHDRLIVPIGGGGLMAGVAPEGRRAGYEPGYENRVKACPLVSGAVRSNEKPSRLELLRVLRDQRCPQ